MAKCADCGFLALRYIDGERRIAEASAIVREVGNVEPCFTANVECYARQFNLKKEEGGGGGPVRTLKIVNRERDCPKFTPWLQGYSPKEHREMLDQAKIAEWQAKQESRNRRTDRIWEVLVLAVGALLGHLLTTVSREPSQPTVIIQQAAQPSVSSPIPKSTSRP